MRAMLVRETNWRGTAVLLILGAVVLLALFLLLRPLQLESPASGGARAMLRLDHALGATVEPVDGAVAKRSGLVSGDGYLVVTSVASGGPAAEGGLRVGDIIQSIGGRPVDQLSITEHSGPMSIWRDGKTIMLDVRIGAAGPRRDA